MYLEFFPKKVAWPSDLAWPDLVPKIQQNVDGNECPLKGRNFPLAIYSRLAMAHEKPEGGVFWSPPPPANNRVNVTIENERFSMTFAVIDQKKSSQSPLLSRWSSGQDFNLAE